MIGASNPIDLNAEVMAVLNETSNNPRQANLTDPVQSAFFASIRQKRALFVFVAVAICATITVDWSSTTDSEYFVTESSTKEGQWRDHRPPKKYRKKGKKHKHHNPKMQDPKRSNFGEVTDSSEDSSNDHDTPPSFPVIEDKSKIPTGFLKYNGVPMPAAEALDCRDSVLAFVINATDVKDECGGLRKAFDKTCNSDSAQGIMEGKDESAVQRTRRLFESGKDQDDSKTWKLYTYQLSRSLSQFARKYFRPKRDLFFAEEEVLIAWEEAKYQIENEFDNEVLVPVHRQLAGTPSPVQRKKSWTRRWLKEEVVSLSVPTNKTTEVKKEEGHHAVTSLKLPTANAHVSDQMLSETVMIQQQDKTIASAIAKAGNHTNITLNEASMDAVVSSKAISETTAAVSFVLNDPAAVEARICCASILNVFHENCETPEGEEVSDRRLFIMISVIGFCGMVKSLIRHFQIRWLPEAGGCILVGVLGAWALTIVPHYDLSFDGNWFLRVMVPPIVFEAALSINKKSFNRHMIPISFFAIIGTLLATAVTAFVVHKGTSFLSTWHLCSTIPYAESLTFGALISSIDPIAVLSVLSNMGMTDTDTIYVVIFGESLLNDGVAIVLFQTLVHFLDESLIIDTEAIIAASIHFTVVAFGSLFVGIASGAACTVYYWAMHGCHTPLVEVLMFFCWAFIPYYICDGIEWSGIVAIVATGFMMDLFVVGERGYKQSELTGTDTPPTHNLSQEVSLSQKKRWKERRKIFSKQGHMSSITKQHVGFVTEILSTLMETAIFAYLGLFLFSSRYHWNLWHSGTAIAACCIGRGVMIPCMSFVANWITRIQQVRGSCRQRISGQSVSKPSGVLIDSRTQMVLWFAGLRGAMSFALVENIPLYDTVTGEGSRFKPELKAMTSATIVFTVFVLGGYTNYLMEHMGLSPSKEVSSYELASLLSNSSSVHPPSPTPSSPTPLYKQTKGSGQQAENFRQRQSNMPSNSNGSSDNHSITTI